MGVPSYFSYIIRTHANILCKYIDIMKQEIAFDRLYMDCNSILYDSFHSVSQDQPYEAIEREILQKTSNQIQYYIEQIKPKSMVYIAFDGVAPFAKMEQQKNRRYRSWYESTLLSQFDPSTHTTFSSTAFTPGTDFMKKLSNHMKQTFTGKEIKEKLRLKEIIVATPDQAGEGEHKLYEHLRKHPTDDSQTVAVYGLDADLIMLSLFHLNVCPNLYIVREAPAFIHVLINEDKNDIHAEEPLFLDVAKLGRCIASEMDCPHPDPHRMYDYVFMCFLLGNDFLPHFPALNIRTHGMQRLMDVYREIIGSHQNRYLVTKTMTIQWREVHRFMQQLGKREKEFIKQEYQVRKKWDGKTVDMYPKTTTKEKQTLIEQMPVLFRGKEKFINPYEEGWEDRYYHTLFPDTTATRKAICMNYLEGLEWVFKYYTKGCMDWRWKYHYHYPPLLQDLMQYMPFGNITFFKKTVSKPLRPITQLAYILPPNLHESLLPHHVCEELQTKYKGCYVPFDASAPQAPPELGFDWAFCRYMWEAHVHFPEITPETVDAWESDF